MIYQIEGTEKFFDTNGIALSVKVITEAQAIQRGFLPPPPPTPEEIMFGTFMCQSIAQLEEIDFIAGPQSLRSKVAKKVIAAKKAQLEKEDREGEAEKSKANGLDGTTLPSRIPR